MATSSRAAKQASDEAVFGDDDTIELVSIFGVLRRRKWLIIAVAALGTTIAAAVGVQLTPSYTAKSQVMIEPQENKIINVEAVMGGLTPDASVLTTQVGILQSRTFLARVMEDLKLFDDPEFNTALNADQAPSGPIATLLEPVQRVLGFIPQEWLIATGLAKEQPVQLESDAPRIGRENAITNFAKSLTIQNETGSYLISVNASSESPQKASKIANPHGRDVRRRPAERQTLRDRPGERLARGAAGRLAPGSPQERRVRSAVQGEERPLGRAR